MHGCMNAWMHGCMVFGSQQAACKGHQQVEVVAGAAVVLPADSSNSKTINK